MKKSAYGFTLIELLIGVGLVGVMIVGIMAFQGYVMKQHAHERIAAILSAKKAAFIGAIVSDAAWNKSVSLNPSSSHLSCIGSSGGCREVSGVGSSSLDISLYDASGALLYASSADAGLNLDGTLCRDRRCAIILSIKWQPACGPTDTNCSHPLIRIAGTFSSSSLPPTIDINKYNFNIDRSPEATSPCTTAPIACFGGQKAICSYTGWTCVPPNPPRCSGVVTWTDSSTGSGTCSAVLSSPGQLHDTTTASVTNTATEQTGSATFLCVPGQPNNGFIQQVGSTCAALATPSSPAPATPVPSTPSPMTPAPSTPVPSIGVCTCYSQVSDGAPTYGPYTIPSPDRAYCEAQTPGAGVNAGCTWSL